MTYNPEKIYPSGPKAILRFFKGYVKYQAAFLRGKDYGKDDRKVW
jgi:hypothetical protein